MNKIAYHLNICCVDGSNYEFWVDDREHAKALLDQHDHEGSTILLHECEVIDTPYEFLNS